ncbi:MAG: bifunctional diaminohydroxyphosphoribosylaminopyrimidine deaminase/5-amino-6-(5-phosphoribosylamino)uracil reductase RibD [Planctomycetota bacterium]
MEGLTRQLDPRLLEDLLAQLGREARAFRFEVAPNPCVGAAVLAQGQVVARGFHRHWGGPHAEIEALAAARASGVPASDWDTLVVTLEPCCTTGKTPPCTEAILASGIRTVVAGALDPDARHRGKGLELLQEHGVDVYLSEGSARLEVVAPHFLRWTSRDRLRRPRPWTVAKWAQTLSGHLSPPENVGDGRWISGPMALADVQVLRSRVDAVVTGVGTILADNPRLTLRPPAPLVRGAPARVVLDSWLRTPPEARLFQAPGEHEGAGAVHVLCLPGSDRVRRRALEAVGATVHELRGQDRHLLDLREVFTLLWELGFQRVLLETGPTFLHNALDHGFVDQVRVVTGSVRGGRGETMAPWLVSAKLLERLDREVGDDAVLEAFLQE